MRVRFLLLLFAAPLFAADVPLAMPPIGPAPYRRNAVFTASNGHGFLVVSAEQRNRQAIFGMLTDPQGLPLARSMFVIHQSPLGDRLLAVASNGDTYLVAYETDVTNGHSVRVARVDDHGGIVARDAGFAHLDDVSMVWSGSAYVVSYANPSPMAMLVASDGTVLRRNIPLVAGSVYAFRISPGPPGTLIATWTGDDNAVHAMPIRTAELQNGTYVAPSADAGSPGKTYASMARVATGGDQSLVVWTEVTDPQSDTTIRARRLDADGHPIGAPFTVWQSNHEPRDLAVAWSGSDFIVAWSHWGVPWGGVFLRVTADDGVTLLRDFSSEWNNLPLISLGGGSRGALMVWNGSQLSGALSSAPDESRLLAPARAAQIEPSVAWCGDAHRAVWTEWSDRPVVVFGRLRAGGAPMDFEGRHIDDSSRSQRLPKIACSASNALVVWKEQLPSQGWIARGALVDADRTPHPAFDLGTLPDDARPVVTWNGSEYVAAWQSAETKELMLMRITHDGQPIGVSPLLRGVAAFEPSLTWNGSEYLALWKWPSGFEAVRLTRELTPIGAPHDIAADSAKSPLVVAGDHEWLLAWDGHYARLSPALEIIDAGSRNAGAPVDGTFDGTSYQLVYGGSSDAVAVSHGGTSPAVIHSREADEMLPRLYVSPAAPTRTRPAGH